MRLIDADKLKEKILEWMPTSAQMILDDSPLASEVADVCVSMLQTIDEQPTVNANAQLIWERDTAIQQLENLGYGFCGITPRPVKENDDK